MPKETDFITGIVRRRSITIDNIQLTAAAELRKARLEDSRLPPFKLSTALRPKISEVIEEDRQLVIRVTGKDPLKDFLNGHSLPYSKKTEVK